MSLAVNFRDLKNLKEHLQLDRWVLLFDALFIGSLYVVSTALDRNVFWTLVGVAALVFLLLNFFFYWTVPKRFHHLPGFTVCFLGAFTFGLTLRRFIGDDDRVTS